MAIFSLNLDSLAGPLRVADRTFRFCFCTGFDGVAVLFKGAVCWLFDSVKVDEASVELRQHRGGGDLGGDLSGDPGGDLGGNNTSISVS